MIRELCIITPVQHSEWAVPMVPIMKQDGSIHLYSDYKVTVNRVLAPDNNPLQRIKDILLHLQGGKLFLS